MFQHLVAGFGSGAVYAVFAVGLVLVFKTTKTLNFAQAEVGTFATFVTWWVVVEAGRPWLVGAAAGLGTAVAMGLVLERVVFRQLLDADRSTAVVATIAVALMLGALELRLWGSSPHFLPAPLEGDGMEVAGVALAPTRVLALVIAAALSAALYAFLRHTTFGLGLLGVAQNPTAVRLAGLRLRRLSACTWTMSAVLGTVASLLLAPTLGAFSAFYLARVLLFGFAAGVLGGGLTSIPGAVLGGLALGMWEGFVVGQFPSVAGLVDASVFLLVGAALLDRARNPFAEVAA